MTPPWTPEEELRYRSLTKTEPAWLRMWATLDAERARATNWMWKCGQAEVERDAREEDLKACAEALKRIGSKLTAIPVRSALIQNSLDEAQAALARPGVKEILHGD